ncbi:hypothetical protein PYW07_014693 [Mythimna separata]|uniref:Mutant cadherin n=1 Tax=Mythimna separata TaxID=271217 RepID=A0AAD7Z1S3_MYTSE|nr:hypothetical protein PYW07_014693 [Mythimna separata]
MTDVLKCNVCNIVIDEMLSYIQNKVSIIDEESLVRICTSSFTSEEIKNSKTLLFESIPTDIRKILRKNRGKEERDVVDIINLFKSTEPDLIPVFVARQLDKLPPILIDHLDCSKLLKDMMTLKAQFEEIKTTFATQDSVNELKMTILRIQNDSLPPPTSAFKVNRQRGAWLDSGPMGLSQDYNVPNSDSCCNNNVNSTPGIKTPIATYREMRVVQQNEIEYESNQRRSSEEYGRVNAGSGVTEREERTPPQLISQRRLEPSAEPAAMMTNEVTSGSTSATEPKKNTNSNEWHTVTYRKKSAKYRYVGKSGVARDLEGTFRAADKKIPMFITNVHITTTESDIIKHICNKTKETVSLERINMKYNRGYKAYKFFISEAHIPRFLDESLWPEGIIFRRFASYKHRNANDMRFTDDNGGK